MRISDWIQTCALPISIQRVRRVARITRIVSLEAGICRARPLATKFQCGMKRFQRLRASATVDGKALLFLESPDGLFNPSVEGVGVGKVPIPAVTVAKGAQVAPQLRDFGSGFAASPDAVGIGGESFDRRDAISGLHAARREIGHERRRELRIPGVETVVATGPPILPAIYGARRRGKVVPVPPGHPAPPVRERA